MSDKDLMVVMAMEKFGGGFVRALAQAFYRADSVNFAKLKAAFPVYWAEYQRMADLSAASRAVRATRVARFRGSPSPTR